MRRKSKKRFNVRRIRVNANGYRYFQWKVEGRIEEGQPRFRRYFPDTPEGKSHADGLAAEKEIEAANKERDMRTAPTRLPPAVIPDAETAWARLQEKWPGKTLTFVVDWFADRYFDPKTDKTLPQVFPDFKAEKEGELRNASKTMLRNVKRFADACSKLQPHDVKPEHIHDYLSTLKGRPKLVKGIIKEAPAAPKTWNNNRADIHLFFEWMRIFPRKWIASNPVNEDIKTK
jgi:hypothetical protein